MLAISKYLRVVIIHSTKFTYESKYTVDGRVPNSATEKFSPAAARSIPITLSAEKLEVNHGKWQRKVALLPSAQSPLATDRHTPAEDGPLLPAPKKLTPNRRRATASLAARPLGGVGHRQKQLPGPDEAASRGKCPRAAAPARSGRTSRSLVRPNTYQSHALGRGPCGS